MESISSIIVIILLIVCCVVGVTFVQAKEQARAKIRQQVAKYRYRANEASDILSNFSKVPIGPEARKLLMQYSKINLLAAKKLQPSDPLVTKQLLDIQSQIQNPSSPVDKQRLTIPKEITKLSILIKNLSTLGRYLQKFKTIKAMDVAAVPVATNRLSLLIAESKICAYIQQGQTALLKHDYVNAQRQFQTAQKMLNKFPKKNSRLSNLEVELKTLIKSTPEQAIAKPVDVSSDETQEEKSDLFGPKKKW